MIKYTIYTEDKNRETIESILNFYFTAYTIIKTIGYWQGKKEKSIIIEIILKNNKYNDIKINYVIDSIKELNNQESVLLTKEKIKTKFI